MKNKKGFTLIELAVSIVLVSIVLVALIGSLLQIRDAYSVVHENSDVIVYTSSISRVINSDINDNNGIKYVNCSQEGRKCSIILGNDERRELEITEDITDNVGDTETNILHSNNKSTLKYLDTTKYDKTNNPNDKEIVYIRTLELDKYDNETTKVVTSKGYNFADMSASQYEYFENSGNDIEAFTTIEIKLLDGINMDISDYNITLYGAGKYDYSNYVGRIYHIDLNNNEADTAGTTSIDEVFGVGFYKAESNHRKEDEINKIKIPTKEGKAFLGYYYKPAGVTVETKVIDSGGNIVASNRTFKESVELNKEETGVVLAKWGDCEEGFHIVDGSCVQEEFTVTLNKNATGKTCNSVGTTSYKVKYQNKVSDVVAPECLGNVFLGYFSSANKQYHDKDGRGMEYYDLGENTTFNANWHTCEAGEYASYGASNCTSCVKGSYSNAQGSGQCTACPSGKTNSGPKQTSCTDCANKNNVLTWKTTTWNSTNNTVTNLCKIQECMTGYHLDTATETCKINTYKITYTLNGGTAGSSNPPTATYNQNVTISNPTRAGYSFKGWTLTNGTSDTAMHGSSAWSNLSTPVKDTTFKNLTKEPDATVTMVANWEECPKGSYNPGGSTTCTPCAIGSTTDSTKSTSCKACQASGAAGASGTTSAAGDTSCNTSCNKAHVSVWETASWNTNNTLTDNCKIKTCATGYTLGSNTCTANTYTISYAGMDGANYGASHPTTATYDASFTVNKPEKTGNTFNGWNITGMDSVTHTYGSNTTTNTSINSTIETSFKNLRSTSGIVTFTAGWTINQYTLTIKPNGGKYNNSASDTVIKQNYGTTYTVANLSELAKYTISYNMNGTGITAPTSPKNVDRETTGWTHSGSGTLNGSTFTFGAGDATLTAGYNTTSKNFTLPGLSKEGNSCNWKEGSTTGTDRNPGASLTINKNITYYAVCKANDYQIIYKDEDGTTTLSGGSPTTYTYGVGATTNWVPTKTNKTFNGWSENTSLTGASFTKTISTTATGAKTFYAKWCQNCSAGSHATCNLNANTAGSCTYTTGCDAGYHITSGANNYNPTCAANTYTVTFNKNNNSATGTMSNLSMTYGTAKALSANAFLLTGYKFAGWNTKSNGTGTTYADKESVNKLTTTNNGTFPLYAQWTINQYTLTIKPNGGKYNNSANDTVITQDYNSTYTVSNLSELAKYTIGYNMNGTGITAPTSPKNVDRETTGWTHSGSGTLSGTTFTFGAGDATLTAGYNTTSKNFTLPGLSKEGNSCKWKEGSATGTDRTPGASLTINKNITYYAKCDAVSYPIIYKDEDGTTTLSGGSPTTYTYGVGATTNWVPTKTNKTFNGWSENTSLTGASFTKTISTTATGAKTFYAKWCQNCSAGSLATCTLNANTAGSCTYTTSCPTGYNISNNGEYNPTCTLKTFNLVIAANANVTAFSIKEGSTSGTSTSCTKSGNNFTCSNVKYGTKYYLYPTISGGYRFGSYEKTDSSAGSSLGSTSQVNTYYQVGNGNGNIKINVNQLTMQIATIDDCGATMVDARDGKLYTTALLGEECWMTKNLDLAGGTTVTPELTNVTESYTLPPHDSTNTWTSITDLSPGYRVFNSSNHGSYYSWDVATAGMQMEEFTESGTTFYKATSDICPKGWRLPDNFSSIYTAACSNVDGTRICNECNAPVNADRNGHPLYTGNTRVGEFGYLIAGFLSAGRYVCGPDPSGGDPICNYSNRGVTTLYFRCDGGYTFETQFRAPGIESGVRCILKTN